MKLFGVTIARTKALDLQQKALFGGSLSFLNGWRGWWPIIQERTTGGWQRNEDWTVDTVVRHPTVFRCITLIQSDTGKLPFILEQWENGVYREIENPAYSPVLRKPNHFQTRQRFIETWMNSKLIHGNAYIIKRRDGRGVVTSLYVLDPTRVSILVAPDGSIFYELQADDIPGIRETVRVPAREMIHDMMPALFHPMIGTSPLYAVADIAGLGNNIQDASSTFFANGAQPGGVIEVPGEIDQDAAQRIKAYWETSFTGTNSGKVALISGGMSYTPVPAASASDSQLIEHQQHIDERIASAFGIPAHKLGVGDQPNYNNIEVLNLQYWAECLQPHADAIGALMTEGLEARPYRIRMNKRALIYMDTATMVKSAAEGIKAGFLAPNEARQMFFDLPPVEGGDTPYMQQQDYSLAALNRRDQANPAPNSDTSLGEVKALLALARPERVDSDDETDPAPAVLEYQKALELTGA